MKYDDPVHECCDRRTRRRRTATNVPNRTFGLGTDGSVLLDVPLCDAFAPVMHSRGVVRSRMLHKFGAGLARFWNR